MIISFKSFLTLFLVRIIIAGDAHTSTVWNEQ